jgi:AcrR family transcriptional regulator
LPKTTAPAVRKRVVKPAEERRREILDSALELFASRGFEETTVQDIAASAGVAIGTVYLYFPSKEQVLLGLHEDFHEGLEARFAECYEEVHRLRGSDVAYQDVVDAMLEGELAYCLERRKSIEVIARYPTRPEITREVLAGHRRFVEAMAESFRKGTTKGVLHTSDPEMSAYLLSAAVSETIMNAIVYNDPPDLDRLLAQAKELFHKALAP